MTDSTTPVVRFGKLGEVALREDSRTVKLPKAIANATGKTEGRKVQFVTFSEGVPQTYEVDGEVHSVQRDHNFTQIPLPGGFEPTSIKTAEVLFPSGNKGTVKLATEDGRKLKDGNAIQKLVGTDTVKDGERTWNVAVTLTPLADGSAARASVVID